jgi:hypothetical protein
LDKGVSDLLNFSGMIEVSAESQLQHLLLIFDASSGIVIATRRLQYGMFAAGSDPFIGNTIVHLSTLKTSVSVAFEIIVRPRSDGSICRV